LLFDDPGVSIMTGDFDSQNCLKNEKKVSAISSLSSNQDNNKYFSAF